MFVPPSISSWKQAGFHLDCARASGYAPDLVHCLHDSVNLGCNRRGGARPYLAGRRGGRQASIEEPFYDIG